MLRTISAASGFGFARPDIDRLHELSKNDLHLAVNVAAEAAKRAVDFLTTQIRPPRADALPYYNQFAVLAEVFRLVPKPSAAQYAAIHRWFWLTASGEYFKGWNEAQMAADREAVAAFAVGITVEIEAGAGMPRSLLWRRSAFRRTNAPSKLLALLLAYAQRETEGEEVIRRRLATCLVDDAAFDAAMVDDYDGFLRARSETLHARLVELIGNEVAGSGELAPLPDEADSEFDPDEPVDRDSAD